jgi:predicted transcriptional regulator
MTRHWRNSLRIYNILSKIETSYSLGFSRDNLIKILKQHNIVLKNLARYIKPLKDTGVLFAYTNRQQMFYQLRY